jgi:hypothetical protein
MLGQTLNTVKFRNFVQSQSFVNYLSYALNNLNIKIVTKID